MERLGEEIRSETGRRPEPLMPPPVVSSPLEAPFPAEATLTVSLASSIPQTIKPQEVDKIEINPEALKKFLREEQGVEAVRVEAINGRLKGGKNVVKVSFIPKSGSDEAILKEYLIICAAVKGFDREGSVDQVIGLIEDETTRLPYMAFQSDLEGYRRFERGEISFEEWKEEVEVKTLQER